MRVNTASPEVVCVSDLKSFVSLEKEWNTLVAAQNNHLFLRHEFLRVWLESFAPDANIQVLIARSGNGRLVAALPLMSERGSIRGIPIRQTVALANRHSCRFDMIAEHPAEAGKAFFSYMAARQDWDVLRIVDVPEDGQAWHLYNAAVAAGFPVGTWAGQRSPFLELPDSEDGLQDRVSSQQRANARRRLRQMEKKAPVCIERLPATDLRAVLDDFFKVESSGWKGREGTACEQDEETRAFYTRLADVAAQREWLSLFRLTLDGQTIAFHYGLTYGNSYLLPKLAYHEAFSDVSPGLVLMHEVIRDCVARQLSRIEFLGSDDEWKLRWSRTVLPHHWIYIFRKNFKGRILQKIKFGWRSRTNPHPAPDGADLSPRERSGGAA
jgi:CelD/BcsL family acetyltransferase involved in cellulose biosynthesis